MTKPTRADPHEGVRYLTPEGAIEHTGTWTVGSRAGDYVFVAGMRGIDIRPRPCLGGISA